MKRILVIILLLLVIITGATGATYDWYSIQWNPNNAWLNNSSQQLVWGGFTGKQTATFGVQYTQTNTPPPAGMTFSRDLTMVVSSEPHLTEFRLTKVGDPTKYWRAYLTHDKLGNVPIDTPGPDNYITIKLKGWSYWGGNFKLNTKTNEDIFPSDAGFNGIYTTYFRFRLYPTAHLLDDDYLLLDETMHYNLKYWGAGQWISTALAAVPYVTEVDVLELQRTAGELKVGSVEFLSDDDSNGHAYKLQVTPGEVGATQFAFHRISGTGSTIPYQVRIPNSGMPASSSFLERTVTTKDGNNHWYDFIELAILGFNPNVTYGSGDYQSRIKITLISNY